MRGDVFLIHSPAFFFHLHLAEKAQRGGVSICGGRKAESPRKIPLRTALV